MRRKFFTFFYIVPAFVALTFTSCLKDDPASGFTLEKELEQTDNYIKGLISENHNVDTTASGVFYVRLKEGTGPFPVAGDTLSVQYVGYLMDNRVFDTSLYNQPDSAITYVHKELDVIPGWEEMMSMMNVGCKMEFVIPSKLAYGSSGSNGIPPYSALIFVAVMRDIRKKY